MGIIPECFSCSSVKRWLRSGMQPGSDDSMGMLDPGWEWQLQESSVCGVCLPWRHSCCAFPLEGTAALGKGEFQPAALKERDLCVPNPSQALRSWNGDHSQKNRQGTALGWELLAAPRSASIPEGSITPGALARPGEGAASLEGAQGEQLTLAVSHTPGIEQTQQGRGGVQLCPEHSRIVPWPPQPRVTPRWLQQGQDQHLQLAVPPLSRPKPSMPMISA